MHRLTLTSPSIPQMGKVKWGSSFKTEASAEEIREARVYTRSMVKNH
jgi:hypothetical protein